MTEAETDFKNHFTGKRFYKVNKNRIARRTAYFIRAVRTTILLSLHKTASEKNCFRTIAP